MPRKPPTKTDGWGKGRQYGRSRGLRLSPDLEEIVDAFAAKYEVGHSEAVRRLVLDGVHQRMDESMTSTADVLLKMLGVLDDLQQRLVGVEGLSESILAEVQGWSR